MICNGQFRWAAEIVLTLLVGSLIVGRKYNANVEAQRTESQAADWQTWGGQGEKGWHSAAYFGGYTFEAMAKTMPILIVS